MKRSILLCGLVMCLSMVAVNAQSHRHKPQTSSDLAGIQLLEEADVVAAKSNDVERLTSLWTEDGVLVQPMSQPVIGRENIHNLLLQQKQQSRGVEVVSYDESWSERLIDGNKAFEWGTIKVKLKLPNGKEMSQSVYAARYLAKSADQKWRFARAIITPAPPQ